MGDDVQQHMTRLLSMGEGLRLEYKEAKSALPTNLFETVCAMLNRDGGDILLGVDDSGRVIGIYTRHQEKLKLNIIPFSKNPTIAKFFAQLGWVEELGSGMVNIGKYLPLYSPGQKPEYRDGAVFTAVIPLPEETTMSEKRRKGIDGVGEKVGEKITKNQQKIIDNMQKNPSVSARELSELVGISQRKIEENIAKLKAKGLLRRVGPAKGGHWEVVSDEE